MGDRSKGKPPDPPDKNNSDWLLKFDRNMQERGYDMDIEYIGTTGTVSKNNKKSKDQERVSNIESSKSLQLDKGTDLLINQDVLLNSEKKNKNESGHKNTDRDREREILLFDKNDIGPYVVYVQNNTGNIGRAHILSVAKLINNCLKVDAGNIININSIGKNRIKVELSTVASANKLVLNEELKNKNYIAYIPQFLVRRKGVIKFVDRSLSEQELLENIKPIFGESYELVRVTRLNRKNINSEGVVEYVPTSTLVVEFKGNYLPKKVAIHRVIMEVEPYIQKVVQCLRCLRYGHLSVQCKGSERCNKCGKEHNNLNCLELTEPYCVLCQGNHKATDYKQCPEFKKQKIIKEIMGVENISYKEAITKYSDSYSNIVQSNASTNNRSVLNSGNQTKRRRRDSEGGNPLLNQHKEILATPKITPTNITQFTTSPQYHRVVDQGKQSEQVIRITGMIITLIKTILSGNIPLEQEIVNALQTSISEIIKQNECI